MSNKEENKEENLSLDCLPNEILEKVLELLPIIDKIRFKPVSKRWNAILAKSLGKTMVVSYKDFPLDHSLTNTKLGSFFYHYGQNVMELSTQKINVTEEFCNHLVALPNLLHLDIGNIEITSNRLAQIVASLPNLLSLGLGCSQERTENSFITFGERRLPAHMVHLESFENLEFVRCKLPVAAVVFSIPPKLKYYDVIKRGEEMGVYLVPVGKASELESLLIGKGVCISGLYSSFNFKSLKYLSIWIGGKNIMRMPENLLLLMSSASNLLALELNIDNLDRTGLIEWLTAIGEHGQKLRHLSICCGPVLGFGDFALNLGSLTSLAIYHCDKKHLTSTKFRSFFEQVTTFGQLQFFKTNFRLPVESICKAVKLCNNLKYIRCRHDYSDDWGCLLQTLDEIYGCGTTPSDKEDYKQIVHFFGCYQIPKFRERVAIPNESSFPEMFVRLLAGGLHEDPPVKHPWLRFHEEDMESPIAEEIRFSCLSKKPKFAGAHY